MQNHTIKDIRMNLLFDVCELVEGIRILISQSSVLDRCDHRHKHIILKNITTSTEWKTKYITPQKIYHINGLSFFAFFADCHSYSKWTFPVFNLLKYNVLGDGESHLYGTEGISFQFRNGFNNFNWKHVLNIDAKCLSVFHNISAMIYAWSKFVDNSILSRA